MYMAMSDLFDHDVEDSSECPYSDAFEAACNRWPGFAALQAAGFEPWISPDGEARFEFGAVVQQIDQLVTFTTEEET